MKAKSKIYMPIRKVKNIKENRDDIQYCLDSKEHPRMYVSMETLEEYMPEEYDQVYVYELKKVISNTRIPGKAQKQKSKKMKKHLRESVKLNFDLFESYMHFLRLYRLV